MMSNCSVLSLEFDKSWNDSQFYFESTTYQSQSYHLFISQLRSGDEIHVAVLASVYKCCHVMHQTLLYCRSTYTHKSALNLKYLDINFANNV